MKRSVFLIFKIVLAALVTWDYWFWQQRDFLLVFPREWAQNFLFFLYALLFIDLLEFTLKFIYQKRRKLVLPDNYILGLGHIFRIVSFALFGLFVLTLLNINVKQLFTSLTIVAAAIAILTKDYITQMVSGMIITFTNHLSLNDYVKINNHKGKIIDIDLFNVHLMNEDDDLLLIPNQVVFSAEVINFSKRIHNSVHIDFEVDITWNVNPDALEKFLNELLVPDAANLDLARCGLKVVAVEQKLVRYKYQFVLNKSDKQLERIYKRRLNRNLVTWLAGFRQE